MLFFNNDKPCRLISVLEVLELNQILKMLINNPAHHIHGYSTFVKQLHFHSRAFLNSKNIPVSQNARNKYCFFFTDFSF